MLGPKANFPPGSSLIESSRGRSPPPCPPTPRLRPGGASVLSRAEAFSFPPGVIHAKTQSQEGQKYRKISKESLGDELKRVGRRRGFEFARQFSGQRFPELGSCHGCWIAGSSCSTGGRSDGQTVHTESQSGPRWQHVLASAIARAMAVCSSGASMMPRSFAGVPSMWVDGPRVGLLFGRLLRHGGRHGSPLTGLKSCFCASRGGACFVSERAS